VLFECRISPSGWTGAMALRDATEAAEPGTEHFDSDGHFLGLCRDLAIKGLSEERQKPRRRSETFGLRHLEYRILAVGVSLHLGSIPPDPDIEDGRIVRQ
jgi:hypothetical protein